MCIIMCTFLPLFKNWFGEKANGLTTVLTMQGLLSSHRLHSAKIFSGLPFQQTANDVLIISIVRK